VAACSDRQRVAACSMDVGWRATCSWAAEARVVDVAAETLRNFGRVMPGAHPKANGTRR
jgi:hypothetical protein